MAVMHTCSLCGFEFDIQGMACHTSCPMSKGCSIICCPNCGYQVPDQNRQQFTNALKRLWDRYQESRRPQAQDYGEGICPLTMLAAGQQAEVTGIASEKSHRLAQLSAYGLIPGSLITLRQCSPACVFCIDETEIALDPGVAREILVRPR